MHPKGLEAFGHLLVKENVIKCHELQLPSIPVHKSCRIGVKWALQGLIGSNSRASRSPSNGLQRSHWRRGQLSSSPRAASPYNPQTATGRGNKVGQRVKWYFLRQI